MRRPEPTGVGRSRREASRTMVIVVVLLAVVAVLALPTAAQDEESPHPVEFLLDAFDNTGGVDLALGEIEDPAEGTGTIIDPADDFEHTTGEEPGFTPDHLDILVAQASGLDPGDLDLFSPTGTGPVWAATGRRLVEPTGLEAFRTFTGEEPHDGNEYEHGAQLFGFTLASTPPMDPPGRCEYLVWVNDIERGPTFVNDPAFPGDPATGTNLAFGLGLDPEDEGPQTAFALELQEDGAFAPDPTIDIRGLITPGYVGILVPSDLIGEIGGIDYYTFCTEDGVSLDPDVSGSDQTGPVAMSRGDFGRLSIVFTVPPTEPTTTTTTPAATTTVVLATTPAAGEGGAGKGSGAPAWWPLLLVIGVITAGTGVWLYRRDATPRQSHGAVWRAALADQQTAEAEAILAEIECEDAELNLVGLELERQEVCRAWPPACWADEEGDWIEDPSGHRITSRDVHMRKVALGDAWAEYKSGRVTAAELEALWKRMDTRVFREDMRRTDTSFQGLVAEIDEDIAQAESRFEDGCSNAERARQRADLAGEVAAAALHPYQSVGIDSDDMLAVDDVTAGSPGALSSDTTQVPCNGRLRHRSSGDPERLKVHVDFSLTMAVPPDARDDGNGEKDHIVFDLTGMAAELGAIDAVTGVRASGLHMAGEVNGYPVGRYVVTTSGVIDGGVDELVVRGRLMAPDSPSTPTGVGTGALAAFEQMADLIGEGIDGWLAGLMDITYLLTMSYQDITATPLSIWECRDDLGWVCVENVWEIEVGPVKTYPRQGDAERVFDVDSDVRRREVRRLLAGLCGRAATTMRQDAEMLAVWRTEHEASPC